MVASSCHAADCRDIYMARDFYCFFAVYIVHNGIYSSAVMPGVEKILLCLDVGYFAGSDIGHGDFIEVEAVCIHFLKKVILKYAVPMCLTALVYLSFYTMLKQIFRSILLMILTCFVSVVLFSEIH